MNEEGITFGSNSTLATALMKWIKASVQQSSETALENWNKTVDEYLEKLTRQNTERSKLIPEVGKIVFKYANKNESAKACMTASGDYAKVKSTLKVLLVAGHYVADADEADEYLGESGEEKATPVSSWYKVKGGLFNDGETHI